MSEVRRMYGAALLHVPHPHFLERSEARARPARARINPTAVLATACALQFTLAVNTTAINTALNSIADDLSMSSGELSWAVGIYMLSVAAFVVLGGRLGDMFGERRIVTAGLLIFGVSAAVVATASSAPIMIGGRALQGLGAAILMPATMAVLRIAYPPERQGFALGVWGAMAGVSFAVGPLIGGVITDTIGWRWVWWGTLIGVVAMLAVCRSTLRAMPEPGERPSTDWSGVWLLAVPLFALILGVQQGPVWGWTSPAVLASFALSAACFVALVVVEGRVAEPMLHLRLLRVRELAAANLATFCNTLPLIGILFFFNLYAQSVLTLDYSAVTASLALLPYGACIFVASLVAGRLCDRVGFRWPIATGLVLVGVGCLLLSRVDGSSGFAQIWWPSMVLGVGVGTTFAAPSAAGLRALPPENAGEASGIINVVRYVSAALVVSVGTIIFSGVGAHELNHSLEGTSVPKVKDADLDRTLAGDPAQVEQVERSLQPSQRQVFEAGAADGVAGGFAAVMLALGLFAIAAAVGWLALMPPARARA